MPSANVPYVGLYFTTAESLSNRSPLFLIVRFALVSVSMNKARGKFYPLDAS